MSLKKHFLLQLLFALAGFSVISVKGIKGADILIILSFFYLIHKYPLKSFSYLFFLFSFFYAWILGGFSDYLQLISNIIVFGLIFLLKIFFSANKPDKIITFIKIFVNSMFISNIIAVFCFLLVPGAKPYFADFSSSGYRFYGFFNQPNGYSFVLIITFFLTLYVYIRNKNIYNLFKLLVTIVSLFLAQSRGAIFGVILGYSIIYFIYLIRRGKLKQIVYSVVGFAMFLALGFIVLPNVISDKFGIDLARLSSSLDSDRERGLTTISLDKDRSYLINASLETIKEYPLGLGFQEQYKIIGNLTGIYKMPHNLFISLFLNYGIILGFFWILIYIKLLYIGFKKIYRNNVQPNNLLFYLVGMLFSLSLFMTTHDTDWSFFYFFIGLYLAVLEKKDLVI